jgi:2-hydroxy-6-oxonona-2,4-dienedioate hydrolase
MRRGSLLVMLALSVALAVSTAGGEEAIRSPKDVSAPVSAQVTVFGAKIHYVEEGNGPVVILLHGLADNVGVWDSTLPALSPRYRVIALDQIGFGKSDKPLLAYRPATFVDFLRGFLDALKIERASLVGSSLGGWVAARFTLAYPDSVDRLVLVDAAGYADLARQLDRQTLNALRLGSREDLRRLGPLAFFDPRYYQGDEAETSFLSERVTTGDGYTIERVMDAMIRGEDVLDRKVRAIGRPTLIVWGRADKLIPLSFAHRFHRDIKDSRLVIVDKCGHMPQVECADPFNAALLRFLDETGAAVRDADGARRSRAR